MSRIGRLPISIPPGVEIKLKDNEIVVKGPNGEMSGTFSPELAVSLEDDQLLIKKAVR